MQPPPSSIAQPHDPTPERIVQAVATLASVLRANVWSRAVPEGLNPAQVEILELAARRALGMRLSWFARQLGVSVASVSDSVTTLVRKGLATKEPDPLDGRVLLVRLTDAGRAVHARITAEQHPVQAALADLPDADQGRLLSLLLTTLVGLQLNGAAPPTRACPSCIYFGARTHPDAVAMHSCALLQVALSETMLRVDCPEHQAAGNATLAANLARLSPTPTS